MTGRAVVVFKFDDVFYLGLCEDRSVQGFKSIEDGLASFERVFDRNHRRSHEASMSACIYALAFQPAIVFTKSIEDLKKKLLPDDKDVKDLRIMELRHTSGYALTLEVDQEKAAKAWEAAEKPKIITQAGTRP